MNYTSDVTIIVHFVRDSYKAQTSYYETEIVYWTNSNSAKGIELTVHWSDGNDVMQSNTDLKSTEQSKYYTPSTYGIYPKEASWYITGGAYSNTLNRKVYATDLAGNKTTIMSGSNKNGRMGSMGTWSAYTATSIPKITVYGDNKIGFNLITYGVYDEIPVTYTTDNSAVTVSGRLILVDGSKFTGTQSVKIFANGKHVQTITITKG